MAFPIANTGTLTSWRRSKSLHQSVLIVIVQWPKILRSANRRKSLDGRSRDSLSKIQRRLWNGQPPPGWPASPWLVVSWTIQGLKYGQIAVGKHLYGVLWLGSASQPRSSWRRDKQTCSFISHWPLSSCWHIMCRDKAVNIINYIIPQVHWINTTQHGGQPSIRQLKMGPNQSLNNRHSIPYWTSNQPNKRQRKQTEKEIDILMGDHQ